MVISVLDFYREKSKGEADNPFLQALNAPKFYILVRANGKVRELILKLSGEVKCPVVDFETGKDFDVESYRNYLIITDFLLGENGERLRESWHFSKEDMRDFIYALYTSLVVDHSTCGLLKKIFLVLIGIFKYYMGKAGR